MSQRGNRPLRRAGTQARLEEAKGQPTVASGNPWRRLRDRWFPTRKAVIMETVGPSVFRKESATRVRAEQRRCALQAELIMSTAECSMMQMRWKLLWTAKESPR
eukprot:13434914-Heterocapsa_arctica.AAC.1